MPPRKRNRSEARVLLTISTTHRPATDLGFLLHKNPGRHHLIELGFGTAHVFYPEASDERCSAAVLVDVDPVGLVRERNLGGRFALAHYVNDRPYASSSFLSVALGRLFGTAMTGRSKERQEAADRAIPLEASLPVAACRGGEDLARRLFEPLGYATWARALPLDPQFPDWGDSQYPSLPISAHVPPRDPRRPRSGPLARLLEDGAGDPDRRDQESDAGEESVEHKVSLHERRLAAVLGVITGSGARSVLDLGCGSGKLLTELLKERGLERIVGLDVSHRALETAARRLHLDSMAPRQRDRVELLHGSLTYRDSRLRGFDAAAVVEVIEHLDPPRLGAFERALFCYSRPRTVT